jgi:integrase
MKGDIMAVVQIRKAPAKATKIVAANQKSIDQLALNSGMWRIQGVAGLYVRCRAQSKSYMLQRRRDGALVKVMLGPLTLKKAKEKAAALWGKVEQPDDDNEPLTLGTAIEQYIEARTDAGKMSAKTRRMARYNAKRYLAKWADRTLTDIGHDRLGARSLQQRLTKEHRPSTSNQVVRLISAVYNWARKADPDLPECPTVACEIHSIKPRNTAYSPDQLRAWWRSVEEKDDKKIEKGVATLNPIRKTFWLTCLLTGARKGSVEALRWCDVDLEAKVMRFTTAKADRVYAIPLSDLLVKLLIRYKNSSDVPPSEWLFPSTVREGQHVSDVKNNREGILGAHRLRHTFRTVLAELKSTTDDARLLMGHATGNDVSANYITSSLVLESLRPVTNAVAAHYSKIIPGIVE